MAITEVKTFSINLVLLLAFQFSSLKFGSLCLPGEKAGSNQPQFTKKEKVITTAECFWQLDWSPNCVPFTHECDPHSYEATQAVPKKPRKSSVYSQWEIEGINKQIWSQDIILHMYCTTLA